MLVKPACPAGTLTRRAFLTRVGHHGGAVLGPMLPLDLLARDRQDEFSPPAGKNRVVILGAGLTAAYELGKLGYDCTVLAAGARPDGPFYFVGEHLTCLGPWMAGAFTSAQKSAASCMCAPWPESSIYSIP